MTVTSDGGSKTVKLQTRPGRASAAEGAPKLGGKVDHPFELVVALAGPHGAGCSSLAGELSQVVNDWPGCEARIVHVSELIAGWHPRVFPEPFKLPSADDAKRRAVLQNAGTRLRQKDREFVGKLIAGDIFRCGLATSTGQSLVVYLVDSLKNAAEVTFLRRLYADAFFFVFVLANRESRWNRQHQYKGWSLAKRALFDSLDEIDQDEKRVRPKTAGCGQQVRELCSCADYYVVNDGNLAELQDQGKRFLHLVMGTSRSQPTISERSMHVAYSASNRSCCLSRQVGAAVCSIDGTLLSVGHNDVPSPMGGLYCQESPEDHRCYLVGDRKCANDAAKSQRFAALAESVKRRLKLEGKMGGAVRAAIGTSELADATEYCRAVHAEMEALLSLCRSPGQSSRGAILYATTEPCHNCAKHIVASGIARVVYIEPYPKSLASQLHSDAIAADPTPSGEAGRKVVFAPYQGVAPRRFHDFFAIEGKRKDSAGKIIRRSKGERAAEPKFASRLVRRNRQAKPPDAATAQELAAMKDLRVYVRKATQTRRKGR